MNLTMQVTPETPPSARQAAEVAAARAAGDQILAEIAATRTEIATLHAQIKRQR